MVYNHSFEFFWKQSNNHLEHCQFFTNSFMKQYILYDFWNNQHWWFFDSDSFKELKLQFSDFETFANLELAILWKLKYMHNIYLNNAWPQVLNILIFTPLLLKMSKLEVLCFDFYPQNETSLKTWP
jgi:hypothetical protein